MPASASAFVPGLLGPVRVVALLGAGLLELGHADPDHERAVAQSLLLTFARRPCGVWLASQEIYRLPVFRVLPLVVFRFFLTSFALRLWVAAELPVGA